MFWNSSPPGNAPVECCIAQPVAYAACSQATAVREPAAEPWTQTLRDHVVRNLLAPARASEPS
eukprot:7309382-Alexandrium_andersonii.AAC.1